METEEPTPTPVAPVTKEPESLYGEWMIAKRRARTKKQNSGARPVGSSRNTEKQLSKGTASGSCIDIVANEEQPTTPLIVNESEVVVHPQRGEPPAMKNKEKVP
ncbi:unnamed protein product [Linum trigynum]|uniref:Uncharacterized protein n=1 Tax=Linum trigynum TaxID=586398 RepID=A0AAV2E0X4_9ROSI